MKQLTLNQIEQLASGPGVKRIAVENFLLSLPDGPRGADMLNLSNDAAAYGWSRETVRAIQAGILWMKPPYPEAA